MSEEKKLQIGTTLGGRYRLEEVIGVGGFGKVYRGRQLNMERDVAIKLLPPRFTTIDNVVERFRREARLASRLRHPHTITIHDYGQHDDHLYIIMEYLEGEDLADRLRREETLPLELTAKVGRQTLASLQEAHELDIVHRDLKPENIFLTRVGGDDSFVKVLDFGIAKLARTPAETTTDERGRNLTVQGNTVGTPTYMSPEQAAGEPVDGASDLYTLGLILYEMVNGEPPFVEESPIRTMRAHLFSPVPAFRNEELRNTNFESIVRKALAKEPQDRFESAAEFFVELNQANLKSRSFGYLSVGSQRQSSRMRQANDDSSPGQVFETPIPVRNTPSDESESVRAEQPQSDEIPFEAVRATTGGDSESSPPGGFSEDRSVTSSIVTILEPSETDDVIVLTQKKDLQDSQSVLGAETTTLEPEQRSPSSPTDSATIARRDVEGAEPRSAADASGSQILTDIDRDTRRRRIFFVAGAFVVALIFVAIFSGLIPLL